MGSLGRWVVLGLLLGHGTQAHRKNFSSQTHSRASTGGLPPIQACAPGQADINGCLCVNPNKLPGGKTYSILMGKEVRCFTTCDGLGSGPRPIVVLPQCYWGYNPTRATDTMAAYRNRGIATVFLSTNQTGNVDPKTGKPDPKPNWDMGVSSSYQPCGNNDDLDYFSAVLQWMDQNLADNYDAKRRFIYGMSHNSAMANFVGYCMSEHFLGVFQSSDCLIEKDFPVSTMLEGFANKMTTTKKYYPVYPCYEPTHTVTTCLASSYNDKYVFAEDGTSMHPHAYDRTVAEGNPAAIIKWTKLSGHSEASLKEDWTISCLGIYPTCSSECWDVATESQKSSCDFCARPLDSLKAAEPAQVTGSFGTASTPTPSRPSSSVCVHVNRPPFSAK